MADVVNLDERRRVADEDVDMSPSEAFLHRVLQMGYTAAVSGFSQQEVEHAVAEGYRLARTVRALEVDRA